MKKVLCLFLCAVMLFSLLPARAEEEKDPVIEIDIEVTLPAPGELPQRPEVKAWARKNGEIKILDSADYVPDHEWREETAENGESRAFSGAFVNGRLYKLTVTLVDILNGYEINDTTKLLINKEPAPVMSLLSVKEGGKNALLTLHFRAMPGDITPAVSVSADGKTERAYNGESATLQAAVTNLIDGVSYSYQWFKDGAAVADGTGKTLKVKNVSDSGVYTCRVSAAATGETKTTESLGLTVKITPHPVTLVMEDAEKNSDEKDPELTYTVLGDAFDPLTGAPAREEGEAEGRYEIDVGTLAFAEDVAENYTVTVRKGHFTIVGTGVQTFAAMHDVADLSYVVGKKSSHVRVSSTRDALPDGAILALDKVDEKTLETLAASAGKAGIMKSLTLSVTPGEDGKAALNKNAVLRLMIPLTKQEERYEGKTIKALFLDQAGAVTDLPIRREADEKTGVVYLVAEIRGLGTIAVLKGKLLPEKEEAPAAEEPEVKPRRSAAWLWILVGLFTTAAAGVIVWVLIRAKRGEAPLKDQNGKSGKPKGPAARPGPSPEEAVKIYEPRSAVSPEEEDGDPNALDAREDILTDADFGEKVEPPPVAGRVISFDDLEDEP